MIGKEREVREEASDRGAKKKTRQRKENKRINDQKILETKKTKE